MGLLLVAGELVLLCAAGPAAECDTAAEPNELVGTGRKNALQIKLRPHCCSACRGAAASTPCVKRASLCISDTAFAPREHCKSGSDKMTLLCTLLVLAAVCAVPASASCESGNGEYSNGSLYVTGAFSETALFAGLCMTSGRADGVKAALPQWTEGYTDWKYRESDGSLLGHFKFWWLVAALNVLKSTPIDITVFDGQVG